MIKAIIFDCFGVLTTESFDVFRNKFLNDDPAKLSQANEAMDELNAGRLDYGQFTATLGELAGISAAEVEKYLSKNRTNEPLFEYIRDQLKPKYKIGLLSNAGDDWLEEMFGIANVALFDSVVLSYKVGVIKPDPKIYQIAARELGVAEDECVYIDDRQKHCQGARDAGMKTFQYRDFQQMKGELEVLLSDSNN